MPKHIIALAAITTVLAGCSAPTGPSASRNAQATFDAGHTVTPGANNCRGQGTATLAQLGKTGEQGDFLGLGGLAQNREITVQDIQAGINTFCAQVE